MVNNINTRNKRHNVEVEYFFTSRNTATRNAQH